LKRKQLALPKREVEKENMVQRGHSLILGNEGSHQLVNIGLLIIMPHILKATGRRFIGAFMGGLRGICWRSK